MDQEKPKESEDDSKASDTSNGQSPSTSTTSTATESTQATASTQSSETTSTPTTEAASKPTLVPLSLVTSTLSSSALPARESSSPESTSSLATAPETATTPASITTETETTNIKPILKMAATTTATSPCTERSISEHLESTPHIISDSVNQMFSKLSNYLKDKAPGSSKPARHHDRHRSDGKRGFQKKRKVCTYKPYTIKSDSDSDTSTFETGVESDLPKYIQKPISDLRIRSTGNKSISDGTQQSSQLQSIKANVSPHLLSTEKQSTVATLNDQSTLPDETTIDDPSAQSTVQDSSLSPSVSRPSSRSPSVSSSLSTSLSPLSSQKEPKVDQSIDADVNQNAQDLQSQLTAILFKKITNQLIAKAVQSKHSKRKRRKVLSTKALKRSKHRTKTRHRDSSHSISPSPSEHRTSRHRTHRSKDLTKDCKRSRSPSSDENHMNTYQV